ncbi:MAG: EndoU domain-containing protein [Wolbachia endosymbiont of Xenopsylla cheopis]
MSKLSLVGFLLLAVVFNNSYAKSIFSDHSRVNNYSNEYKFNPFFKTIGCENCEFLPPIPKLNAFDEAMLEVCGNWGNVPRNSNFISVLSNNKYQDEFDSIYNELNHQVITPNADTETFKKELAMVWFGHNAFRHVFCGEPNRSKLGGMHFVGRYLEAQEKGWAGITENKSCPKEEIEHPIYTLGVDFLNPEKKVKTKCQGGYDYSWHAKDILILATKALKDFQSEEQGMCLYDLPDGNKAVFVKKSSKAITTFYSELTPHCDRGKTSCGCR